MAQRLDLAFVDRDAWGARYPAGSGPRPLPLVEAWLHHTVTLAPDLSFRDLDADSVDDDEAKAMRQVEAIGQQRFGAGFSYNLAVMPSGRLYVGCGVRRIGAHTKGRNTKALGVVLVGDYSKRKPPVAMVDALVALLQYAKQERWLRAAHFTGGHRDAPGASTACPGAYAHKLLPEINERAAGTLVTPPPVIVPTPTAPTLEDPVARLIKTKSDPTVWATDGLHRWHVVNQDVLADLRATGVYGDGKVHVVSDLTVEALVLATGDTTGTYELPAPTPADPEPGA